MQDVLALGVPAYPLEHVGLHPQEEPRRQVRPLLRSRHPNHLYNVTRDESRPRLTERNARSTLVGVIIPCYMGPRVFRLPDGRVVEFVPVGPVHVVGPGGKLKPLWKKRKARR